MGFKVLVSQPHNIQGLTAQPQNDLVFWALQHSPEDITANQVGYLSYITINHSKSMSGSSQISMQWRSRDLRNYMQK